MDTEPLKQPAQIGPDCSKTGIAVVSGAANRPCGQSVRTRGTGSLEQALADALLEDGEEEFDCMLLFEFPATMLGGDGERSASCLCRLGGKARLIFIATSDDGHSVRLFDETEVSRELAELSWSYARILSFMPATLTRQQQPAIN